ncbi:MAG: valine--pyruvate transaminase [Chromatiales bacterium]|nr:valine--pyruvate transaminase [Chromatiales bacterium]
MEFSSFGRRFTEPTGTRELMEDLGAAMAADTPAMMLGGGNPAHIPGMLAVFREEFAAILDSEREFRRMVADYADPAGEQSFRQALAALLNREHGWSLGPENIALTAGSQSGFFLLFNLLAGPRPDGSSPRVLLPLTPEYIGYADQGISGDLFVSRRPLIELLPDRQFKYRVDFDRLPVDQPLAAICVSRPTNPTGNVLTDDEVARLSALAAARDVPFIIDNAYGLPFPRILFTGASLVRDENTVLCMSLSKLGLPGVRTGIVVARPEIIDALAGMNAVTSLAVGSVGPVLLRRLVETGRITQLSRELIQPFYRQRMEQALGWLHAALDGLDYRVHKPEGALFLWLWLPGLPISSSELYQRLKARGVMVLSGHHFFPGLDDDWPHRQQCLRITYCREEEVVQRGIRLLGEELRALFRA